MNRFASRHPEDFEERIEAMQDGVGRLAEEAGIDVDTCEFCHRPLDDSKPWRRGLDGAGAHESCLKAYL